MSREIEYTFEFDDETAWNYVIPFDSESRFIPKEGKEDKPWTKLEFNQCPHCPLNSSDSPQCPVARNLDQVVEDSKNAVSSTQAKITIKTKERTYVRDCAAQEGLRSLFGVIMASSGCPHLDWLRPLSRFHLPFADIDETLFRVLSVQVLEQYFHDKEASLADCSNKLSERYKAIEKVNHTFIERIRSYCEGDADKNAIAALDVYAQMFPYQQQMEFDSLKRYFDTEE